MLDVSRKPDGSHLELGMAWACECLWVPDYYPQGHHGGRGAFVMYWSSTVFNDADKAHDDKNVYCTVLWGATTDFTQDTFEYGGVFIDNHGDAIDTTMIQRPLPDGSVRTYRITKDNAHGTGIWMDRTDAKRWWEPGTVWTKVQGLAQATCRTATPAAWKVLRCSPTTTTTVARTTNGTCSWT